MDIVEIFLISPNVIIQSKYFLPYFLQVTAGDSRDSLGRGRFFPLMAAPFLLKGFMADDYWLYKYMMYPFETVSKLKTTNKDCFETNVPHKGPFHDHFWPFFANMYVDLSQN